MKNKKEAPVNNKKSGGILWYGYLLIRTIVLTAGLFYVGYWPFEQLVSIDSPRAPKLMVFCILIAVAALIWSDHICVRYRRFSRAFEIIILVTNYFALFISLIPYVLFFIMCLFSSFGNSAAEILRFVFTYLVSLLIYAEYLYCNWRFFRSKNTPSDSDK